MKEEKFLGLNSTSTSPLLLLRSKTAKPYNMEASWWTRQLALDLKHISSHHMNKWISFRFSLPGPWFLKFNHSFVVFFRSLSS